MPAIRPSRSIAAIVLAATALDLDSCPVGGFYDRKVDSFLGVDGLYEASLYLLPVGGRER